MTGKQSFRWRTTLFTILALLLLLLTGVGPLIAWRRASPANLRRQFVWPGALGLLTLVALAAAFWGSIGFWPLE